MVKSTAWSGRKIAESYESGRWTDSGVLMRMYSRIGKLSGKEFRGLRILDAGCGTGRLTFPLAVSDSEVRLFGADKSAAMLAVLKRKIRKSGVKNFSVKRCSLSAVPFADGFFDAAIVASVLHSAENWREILLEIARCVKKGGALIFISEDSDVYRIALGKKKPDNSRLLERFWGKYFWLRGKNGLRPAEASQVGIKWRLGVPEAFSLLKSAGLVEKCQSFDIRWKRGFTVSEFMEIVRRRVWSSMFTEDTRKYAGLVRGLKEWIREEKIPPERKCVSSNILRCEVAIIGKARNTPHRTTVVEN